MKKLSILLCCLLLPLAMTAQERTGNINGIVVDQDGIPLPGVTVTLTGLTIAPIRRQPTRRASFRFLSLFPGKDYQIKLELQGFKTRIRTGIIVEVGKNADLTLIVMEQGKLEEQVTVVAQTPVVQAKKTQVTTTSATSSCRACPPPATPGSSCRLTPAVFIDRENIGGTNPASSPPS